MQQLEEIWKDIEGYEGKYQVSNHGKVKSKFKIFNGCLDKEGYLSSSFRINGIEKRIRFHRIVAIHFIPNPENKYSVNHKDGNKLNNHVDNLEWMTLGENTKHAIDNNLFNHRGSKHVHSKLTEEDVIKMRSMKGEYNNKQLGKLFNISREQARDIVNRKMWKHV